MYEAQIYEKLTEVFHEVLDDDSIVFAPRTSAKDIDGWDSLTHIRLIITVEKTFKTKFSTSEIGRMAQVSDLVALIQSHS